MKRIHFIAAQLMFLGGSVLAAAEVDFAHQIVPILKQHCVECHGGHVSKGGFSINKRERILEHEAAVPGRAEVSLFLQLIGSTDTEDQMPPEEKPRVSPEQLVLLRQWVDEGMVWEPGFSFATETWEPEFEPRRPALPPVVAGRQNPIDRLVDDWMASRDRNRPAAIDEATFLRRVSMDIGGLLPSAERVRTFLADAAPNKRLRLVDELFADELAYTEHWLTFWNDLLRNDYDGTGFITGGRTQISEWLYESLLENKPFDRMVRELVAPPDETSAGFINGIKWRGTVSAGQTLPIQFSQSLSQSFLGINLKCASCHDSFIDRWTLKEAYGLAAIYSETPLQLYRCDQATGETAAASWLFPEIGQIDSQADRDDRLKQLAGLMTHPKNGRVTRTIVNRLWGQLMGRGIVHPLDAMQSRPWHRDLLDWLAVDFQEHGYDLKRTIRLIVTSSAYQSRVAIGVGSGEGREFVYSGPQAKRLTAEQFVDAIWQISGTAPVDWDAPVTRGVVKSGLAESLAFESQWLWGPSASRGAPPAGEKILLRRQFSVRGPVVSAGIIGTADNRFRLYLNGSKVLEGKEWTRLEAVGVGPRIQEENTILVVAENGGGTPNPAGAFFAIRLVFEDGTDEVLVTDERWELSLTVPKGKDASQWDLDSLDWVKPHRVPGHAWKGSVDPAIGRTLAKVSVGSARMVRAALLKADRFMRTLGRPNRDQIVTSRPAELTTLEAVNLATSDVLAEHLEAGAKHLVASVPADRLVEEIYLALLSRFPTKDEQALAASAVGVPPRWEPVADLLWAITMTPEFLILR